MLTTLHRRLALATGAFVVLVGLSGASLVFREELAPWLTPALEVAVQADAPGAYQRVLSGVLQRVPEAGTVEIRPPQRPDRPAEVLVQSPTERRLYVNVHTGAIVADSALQWLPFDTLFRLHRDLLVGPKGEDVVACAGLMLAFLSISGLKLGWPRRWRQALHVRRGVNALAFSFDLHKAMGRCFAVLLLASAATGLVLVFSGIATAWVNRLAATPDIQAPALPMSPLRAAPGGTLRPLDELVAAADTALPQGVVTQVVFRGPALPVVVRKRMPTERNPLGGNRVHVDPVSGQTLGTLVLQQAPAGNRMFSWLYPLHTGRLFGLPHRTLVACTGLAPLALLLTGLVVWRRRAQARKVRTGITPDLRP